MIWKVEKTWVGETVFILGGGPSLRIKANEVPALYKPLDASILRAKGNRVITINDSWMLAPWADVNYFCDAQWWQRTMDLNPWAWDRKTNTMYRSFHDQIYKGFWVSTSPKFYDHPQVHCLRFTGQLGLEDNPEALRHGSNSGYAAINLAYLFGAKRIVLLGYDMHCEGERTHWHNNSSIPPKEFEVTLRRDMLPLFSYLVEPLKEAEVEVLNATINSSLKCWPYVPLELILNPQMELKEA